MSDTVRQVYGLADYDSITTSKEFVCGIEYEIEDITQDFNGLKAHFSVNHGITVTKDGSLRNNGMEFVTEPGTIVQQGAWLKNINDTLKLGDEPFTHRTSTHVHVNVLNLSLEKLHTFTMIYAMFEPLFFDFAGGERKNSIFCVPLNYTFLPSKYNTGITSLINLWSKYTAYNLKRTPEIGTVEFRHLFGTNDWKIISKWLTLLSRLYEFVRDNEFSLKEYLLSGGSAINLLNLIFKIRHQYNEVDFYDNVLDVKLSYIKN